MQEVIFLVEESPEGGFEAKAVGYSIYAEADTMEELHEAVKDAVRAHFDGKDMPKLIRLHFVRDEIIAV